MESKNSGKRARGFCNHTRHLRLGLFVHRHSRLSRAALMLVACPDWGVGGAMRRREVINIRHSFRAYSARLVKRDTVDHGPAPRIDVRHFDHVRLAVLQDVIVIDFADRTIATPDLVFLIACLPLLHTC